MLMSQQPSSALTQNFERHSVIELFAERVPDYSILHYFIA